MVRTGLLGRIAIAIDADFAGFRRESRSAGRTTAQIRRQMNRLRREARAASVDVRRLQGVLRNFRTIAVGAFAGFGIAEVTRGVLAFDRELTKINTLVGVNRETLQAWREDLVNISRTTAILPQELSGALFNIVSVGLEGQEALRALDVIARATATGLGDLGQVADATTRLFGAFRVEAIEMTEAADVLFTAIRLGNDTADEFVQGFSRLAKQAANAGISINDLGASMAFLTRSGFTARRAALGLGQVFGAIIKPAQQAITALEEIGLTVEDFQNLFTDDQLVEGLTLLNDLANARGVPLTQIFPDKEAINTALTFIREAKDAQGVFGRFEREVQGAADRAFRQLELSPEFQIRQSLAAINTQFQELASNVLPPLSRNFDTLTSVTTGLLFAFGILLPAFRGLGLFLRRRRLNREIDNLVGELDVARRQTSQAGAATQEFRDRVNDASRQIAQQVGEQERVTTGLISTLTGFGAAIAGVSLHFLGLGDYIEGLTQSPDQRVDTSDLAVNVEFNRLDRQLGQVNEIILRYFDELDDATDPAEIERLNREILRFENRATELRQEIVALRRSLSVGLDFVNTGAFAALGDQLAEEIQEAQTEATEAETRRQTIEFEPIIPAASLDRIFNALRQRVQDASLSLSLENATPFDSTLATQRLQFGREVAQEIAAIEDRRVEVNKRIAAEKEKGNAADFNLIAQQEDLIGRLNQQERQLRDSLDVNTEIGAEINAQFIALGNIAQARQDNIDAARRDAERQRALADFARDRARVEENIYAARIQGSRTGQDLVLQARQELELARLTSKLRDADPALLQAELTIREAQFDIDRRRLALQRDFADADEALRRARREGNAEAVSAALGRIAALEAESEGLQDLTGYLRQYADLQRQIAEEGTDRLADKFRDAFRSMEDSLDSFIRATLKGEESFERFVNAMLDHIFSLVSTRDLLSTFGTLLSALGFGGGLISGGTGAASVNFGAPGFRHQGGQASGFTIVGEHGPELVDFQTPSRVYSNTDLAEAVGGTGGVVLNQTNRIESTDGPGTRRAIAVAMPEIIRQTVAAVRNDLADRGSGLRAALR